MVPFWGILYLLSLYKNISIDKLIEIFQKYKKTFQVEICIFYKKKIYIQFQCITIVHTIQ